MFHLERLKTDDDEEQPSSQSPKHLTSRRFPVVVPEARSPASAFNQPSSSIPTSRAPAKSSGGHNAQHRAFLTELNQRIIPRRSVDNTIIRLPKRDFGSSRGPDTRPTATQPA